METTRSSSPPGSLGWSSIERWTVERLDRDAGMARIESVPMRSEYSGELFGVLLERGVEVGMDRLALWDAGKAQIRPLSIERLVGELGLRPGEEETLSENMVFWVLRSAEGEPDRVVHATQAARQVSKVLYRAAARRERRRR